MKKRWIVLGVVAIAAAGLFVLNTSLLAHPKGAPTLLAHRGPHQRFNTENLQNNDCTATRMLAPTHSFLENTLPSIEEAFRLGADMVEIDIHPTTDGEFVVFHDWTLECRTNGSGVTRDHSMAEMRGLDVGYGYTADGGQTFPFRGQGVGMMKSLREVLAAFPDGRFLINFKGSDIYEADLLIEYLEATPNAHIERLAFYGHQPATRMRELRPTWRSMSLETAKACAKGYVLAGWIGVVPEACHNTIVFAPANYAWIAWGWPNRFLQRMEAVNTEVYVTGPIPRGQRPGMYGIDDAEDLTLVPRGWRGGIGTDAIEVIGPLVEPP
ncbi:MAG: glycerophosphodiester phosphodiesterase family protein [Terricaulis sp.]